MANVDNLNFKVIIDDAQFNKKIKAMEKMAKDFNTSLSNLLNVQAVSQELVVSNRKRNQMETDNVRAIERQNREKIKTEGLQRKINAQIERATKGYNQQSRILQELKGYALGYLSIHGATQLLSSLVRVTGEFELQKTTLAAMLGDLNKAEQVITRIQALAVESPFQFKELTIYAKQLSAFSVPAEELFETTKMLADISAGLGVGMDRIVLAYGQVRSAAFLRGQEVRQFTEAGIPILDELAKQFSELEGRAVSTGEVFDKISARLVPFEMVAKVMKDLTSEGGKFYNMQEVQAETLRGKISNLKDAYEVMLNEIGSAHTEKLKGAVDMVRKMMQNYDDLGKTIAATVITFGVARTAIELLSVAMGKMALKSVKVVQSLRNVQAFALKNPYVLIAAGITATGVAIYRASTALKDYEKVQQSVVESKEKFNKAVNTEIAKLDTLYAKLRVAKKGTEEYDSAKKQIFSQYSGYISELKAEGVAVDNLATVYVNLKNKINEANKTRFLSSATEDIERTYGEGLDKLYKRFVLISQNIGDTIGRELMAVEKESLWQYILGDETALNIPEAEGIRGIVKDIYGGYGLVVERAQKDAKALSDAYTQGLADIQKAFDLAQRKQGQNAPKLVDGWRKTVQDTLKGMGLDKGTSFGIWAEDTTQSTSYVEDMIKRYKELGEEIKWVSSFDTDQAERLKKNKDAIEAIAKALKIDIKNLAANDSDTWEAKEEKRIKRLIETLRKLQDNYDKLKVLGVSDDSIKTLFEGLYPELIKENGKDFVTDLKYLERAIDLVEELEKYAPEDAKKILVDLGGDEFSQYLAKLKEQIKGYKESAKAAGEYYNTLRKWATEDFNIDGEGITLDVSKIASDLNGKIREIELRATKARELFAQIDVDSEEEIAKVKEIFVKEFGADAWEDFWDNYYTEGVVAIDRLTAKQKEYEKKLAQEKVNDLAQKYVKESYFEGNIELTDLGDKNVFQLNNLRKRLQDLLNEKPLEIPIGLQTTLLENGVDVSNLLDVDLSEFFDRMDFDGVDISEANKELLKLIQQIQKAGLSTEKFGETIKQIFKGDLKELSSEQMQALGELGQMVGEQILSIASALSELGQASGNSQLEPLGNQISDLGDAVNNIAQGFKSGDWIGGLIAGIGSLATKVVQGMAEAEQATQNAAEKAIEYADRIKEIEFDNLMKSSETIFGVNEYQKMIDAAKEAVKYQEEVQKNVDAIGVSKQDKFDFMQGMSGWATFSKGAQDAAKMVEDLGLGDILVDERSGWQKFWGTGNDLVKVFNINDFIDADENLMGEELRNLVNQYGDDMSDETKNAINKTLKEWDLYVKSMEQVTSYLTDMFGQVADQMADSFVTAFKETGQAAIETESIMDEVSTNIAKSVVKSMIVQNVFKPEDIEKISSYVTAGDTAQALAETDKLLANAEGLYPMIQKYLEGISEYFQMGEDMGSQSLGDGIKGITEDTANLLASYLNAIRADVSYARTIWERMDATTQRIASILVEFSAPSLMEYQAQIAANTYNTMIATQSILSKLDAVVTYSDGPAGVRVYS